MREGLVLLSYLWPAQNQELLKVLADKKVNAVAMDAIPRISRAQKMDVLSSMANIAGYRSVIEASFYFGRFLNGQITAAGKVEPAKVLVIGAGVAGLAAIGAANSLGAIVRAFDTRKEVAEQIQSMGASFLTVEIEEDGATSSGYSKEMSKEFIEAEMKLFLEQAAEVDIIITTAQIPGRPAPKLILDYHVAAMKPGSVIVDLAASTGGNCVLTKNGEVHTTENGVVIVGKLNLLPNQASQLYGNNLCHLLDDMGKAEKFNINMICSSEAQSILVSSRKMRRIRKVRIIERISSKTCKLVHLPYGDAYRSTAVGNRGECDLHEIQGRVEFEDLLKQAFATKSRNCSIVLSPTCSSVLGSNITNSLPPKRARKSGLSILSVNNFAINAMALSPAS
jgi:NAD(P) transhydrogenase alpha subunit